jgi:hypothetical protein
MRAIPWFDAAWMQKLDRVHQAYGYCLGGARKPNERISVPWWRARAGAEN